MQLRADALFQHHQAMRNGGLFTRDGRQALHGLVLHDLAGASTVPRRLAVDLAAELLLQIGHERLAVLQHDRVRQQAVDFFQLGVRQRAEAVLLHARDLAHDLERGRDQPVQITVERARNGVLHGQHAVLDLPALDGVHDLRHVRVPDGLELGRRERLGQPQLLERDAGSLAQYTARSSR